MTFAAPTTTAGTTPTEARQAGLEAIAAEVRTCTRCRLAQTRTRAVPGEGHPDTEVVFVGEGPGQTEDQQGRPFVGRAGDLLVKLLSTLGWRRQEVFITNIVKCRPPGNRDPEPDEIAACRPFLDAQIQAVRPRMIVTLGRPATNVVLGKNAPISSLRGRFHEYRGVRVMPTFHPAYLLRDPSKKREAWEDLQQVMAELERLGVAAPRAT